MSKKQKPNVSKRALRGKNFILAGATIMAFCFFGLLILDLPAGCCTVEPNTITVITPINIISYVMQALLLVGVILVLYGGFLYATPNKKFVWK
ncbi:MAG: hypothetical protein LBL08_03530 [Candidatus Nomurabacteria bacterium]|jgi:hypothetical protein|nr:hypothetical protein [Candidatus Nomurabacteria bacterium]